MGKPKCPRSPSGEHEIVNKQGKDPVSGKIVTFLACKWCSYVRGRL